MSLKQFVKAKIPHIFKALKSVKSRYYLFLGKNNPELLIKKLYKGFYNRPINLINPKDIDEKVNYLKLYGDTTLWSRYADKYAVRSYVEECGLKHTLNQVYGVYDKPDDIKLEDLPDSFVVKTTNGGGNNSVLIVNDKQNLDKSQLVLLLNKWLKIPMGYKYGESHYDRIKPRILIEKKLPAQHGHKSLIDYKFNCFDGRVYSCFVTYEREIGKAVGCSLYDLEWNLRTDKMRVGHKDMLPCPKPSSLDFMIKYSSILSKGIPYVRVDWYEIEGKPIFGELTFTPCGGFQTDYNYDYLLELGEQMNIGL